MNFREWLLDIVQFEFLAGNLTESLYNSFVSAIIPEASNPAAQPDYPGRGWVLWRSNHDDKFGRYRQGDEVWYNRAMPVGQKIRVRETSSQAPAGHQPSTAPMQQRQVSQPAGRQPQRSGDGGQPPQDPNGQRGPRQPGGPAEWVYAKVVTPFDQRIPQGRDIAVHKIDEGWIYATLDWQQLTGRLDHADIRNFIQAPRDSNNMPYKAATLDELYQKLGLESPKKQEKKKKTKPEDFRISDETISEQQLEIEKAFLGFDPRNPPPPNQRPDQRSLPNMVLNALAGTGKTTMLKHLASYKDPKDRWLYLVFNAKNAAEAEGEFPKGVDTMTSHSFLLKILKQANSSYISNASLPEKDEKRKKEKLEDLMDEEWFDDMARYDLEVPKNLIYPLKRIVKKTAALAKNNAVDPRNRMALADSLRKIIEKYDIDVTLTEDSKFNNNPENIDYTEAIVSLVAKVLDYSMPGSAPTSKLNSLMDFDDILWWTAIMEDLNWKEAKQYSVVLADEIQDFNLNQRIMLRKLDEIGCRIVAVGDPNQAIYRFRGADAQSFKNLQDSLGESQKGATVHDLPTNFRCGKNIIDYANAVTKVKGLKHGAKQRDPNDRLGKNRIDKEGQVTEDRDYQGTFQQMENEWAKERWEIDPQTHRPRRAQPQMDMETAFISRTNKPLVATAMNLLKKNIDFEIVGRDLSKELITKIGFVLGSREKRQQVPIENVSELMHDHLDQKKSELEHLQQQSRSSLKKKREIQELEETIECLDNVLEHIIQPDQRTPQGYPNPKNPRGRHIATAEDFIGFIQTVLGGRDMEDKRDVQAYKEKVRQNPKGFVTLTTAHRSKGLEFERVYILGRDTFPHPKAKSADELDQEENALYVALTRAKDELHVLTDPTKQIGAVA